MNIYKELETKVEAKMPLWLKVGIIVVLTCIFGYIVWLNIKL